MVYVKYRTSVYYGPYLKVSNFSEWGFSNIKLFQILTMSGTLVKTITPTRVLSEEFVRHCKAYLSKITTKRINCYINPWQYTVQVNRWARRKYSSLDMKYMCTITLSHIKYVFINAYCIWNTINQITFRAIIWYFCVYISHMDIILRKAVCVGASNIRSSAYPIYSQYLAPTFQPQLYNVMVILICFRSQGCSLKVW